MIVRRVDWQPRLAAFLDEARGRAFDWNGWDCCHFVGDAVLAMSDTDPLADYRGDYETEAGAWAALDARDGNLRAACKRVFGAMRPAAFARRGDAVMLAGNLSIGICMGGQAVFASPDGEGLTLVPMSDCRWCFPIGWPESASEAASDAAGDAAGEAHDG